MVWGLHPERQGFPPSMPHYLQESYVGLGHLFLNQKLAYSHGLGDRAQATYLTSPQLSVEFLER